MEQVRYKVVHPETYPDGSSPHINLSHYIVLLEKPLIISKNGEIISIDEMAIFSEIPDIMAIIRDSSKRNNGFYKIIGKLIFDYNFFYIKVTDIDFIRKNWLHLK